MNSTLRALYWWLERKLNPGAESSQYVYQRILRKRVAPGAIWIDAGCGTSVMPDWVRGQSEIIDSAKIIIGMDALADALAHNKQLSRRVAGDVEHLPFSDRSVSLITANMVVEHIEHPAAALREIQRILVPDGCFVFHTTNKRHYLVFVASLLPQWFKDIVVRSTESRDPFKAFYRMNTVRKIEKLSKAVGLLVDEITCTDTSSISGIYFGPFLIPMLLYSRLLRWEPLRRFRSNIIVVLRKASEPPPGGLISDISGQVVELERVVA